MPGSVVAASDRTPIGELGGSLSSLPAVELGGFAITAARARAGIEPDGAAALCGGGGQGEAALVRVGA